MSTWTPAQVRDLVSGLGDIAAVLNEADHTKKAQLYDELGLNLVLGLLLVWLTSFTPGCSGGKDVSHAEEVPR